MACGVGPELKLRLKNCRGMINGPGHLIVVLTNAEEVTAESGRQTGDARYWVRCSWVNPKTVNMLTDESDEEKEDMLDVSIVDWTREELE